jgi:hypothetical protein
MAIPIYAVTGFWRGARQPQNPCKVFVLSTAYTSSPSDRRACAFQPSVFRRAYLASYGAPAQDFQRRRSRAVKNFRSRSLIPFPGETVRPRLRRASRASSCKIPTGSAHRNGMASKKTPQLGAPNGELMACSFLFRNWTISIGALLPIDEAIGWKSASP